jgi:hypothetical protein
MTERIQYIAKNTLNQSPTFGVKLIIEYLLPQITLINKRQKNEKIYARYPTRRLEL